MTWVNLGVLGIGAALVAVPILLHLLMQPKPVEVTFRRCGFYKSGNKRLAPECNCGTSCCY